MKPILWSNRKVMSSQLHVMYQQSYIESQLSSYQLHSCRTNIAFFQYDLLNSRSFFTNKLSFVMNVLLYISSVHMEISLHLHMRGKELTNRASKQRSRATPSYLASSTASLPGRGSRDSAIYKPLVQSLTQDLGSNFRSKKVQSKGHV